MANARIAGMGRLRRLLPLLVAVAAFAAFLPALKAGFVNWDDDKALLFNPEFRGLGLQNLRWMFSTFYEGIYQPLCWLSYGVDYAFWGMDPRGYHLTNLLLHAANAALFYFLAFRLLEDEWAAALAALLFAVHPLRVESVAWVSERKDVLSGAFYLLSTLFYVDGRLGASLGFFAAGLLSKASGIGLPFVFMALDYFPLGRGFRWKEKLPFLALSVAAGIAGLAAKRHVISTMEPLSAAQHLAQAVYGLAFYLYKTVLPFGLYPVHEITPNFDPFASTFIAAAGGVGILAVLLAYFWKSRPGLAPAVATYLAFLGPVLGLVTWNRELVADRYSYLACAGLPLLAAGALAGVRHAKAEWRALAVVVVLALGVLTWRQSLVWTSSQTLWAHDLAYAPDSSMAHNNLGSVYADAGRYDESVAQFQEAIRLKPNYWDAAYNMGNTLTRAGRFKEAFPIIDAVLKIKPDFANARVTMGNILDGEGRYDEAVAQYRAALKYQPGTALTYFNMGLTLCRQGKRKEAYEALQEAARLGLDQPVPGCR